MSNLSRICCPNCNSKRLAEDGLFVRCLSCRSKFEAKRYEFEDENVSFEFYKAVTERNELRFDDAEITLSNLLEHKQDNPDIYYQMILAKLGVKYVDDYGERTEKPTISRLSSRSIFDMPEYDKIVETSNSAELDEFIEKLDEIEVIRKKTFEISEKIESFDVFISFKQRTDDLEGYTKECEVAEKIYNYLKKDYKVFFSKATLASHSGEEYEPIIYHALTTSKVMLVISATASKNYCESPWVKNEWTRFIKFMKEEEEAGEKKKILVPILAEGYSEKNLPAALKKFEAIKYDPSFKEKLSGVLSKYVDFATTNSLAHNEVIEAAQIKTITAERINKKLRATEHKEFNESLKKELSIPYHYYEMKEFEQAKILLERISEKYPDCYENPEVSFLAFLVHIGYVKGENNNLKSFSKTNKNLLYSFLHNSLSNETDENKIKERLELLKELLLNTLDATLENCTDMFSFIISFTNEVEDEKLSEEVMNKLKNGLKNDRYEAKDVISFYQNTLYVVDSRQGAEYLIEQYNYFGNYFLEKEKYNEALTWFNHAIELYSASIKAITGSFYATYETTDLNIIASKEDVCKKVEDALRTLRSGKPNFKDISFFYDIVQTICTIKLEQNNADSSFDLFNILYGYIPEAEKEYAKEVCQKFGNFYLKYALFDYADTIFNELITLSPDVTNKFDFVLNQICAKLKCQNYVEFLIKEMDFNSPEYFDILSTLNFVCGEDPTVEDNLFIRYTDIHKRVLDKIHENNHDNSLENLRKVAEVLHKARENVSFSVLINKGAEVSSVTEYFAGVNFGTIENPKYIAYSKEYDEFIIASSLKEQENYIYRRSKDKEVEEAERIKKEKEMRLQELKRVAKIKRKKRIKIISILLLILITLGAAFYSFNRFALPSIYYNKAEKYYLNSEFDEAKVLYEKTNYSDAKRKLALIELIELAQIDYLQAKDTLTSLGGTVKETYLDGLETGYSCVSVYDHAIMDVLNETLTIYYRYEKTANKYSLTLKLYDGKLTDSVPSTFTIKDEIILPDAEKLGFDFMGWIINDDDTPTKGIIIKNKTEDLTFRACFLPHDYKVSLDVDGGIYLADTSFDVTYLTSFTLQTPTKLGFTFVGWTYDNKVITDFTYNYTTDVTLVAKYEVNTYTISYNLNGGSLSSANPTRYTILDDITLSNPSKVGYHFIGWSENDSATYNINQVIKNRIGNLSFKAMFEPISSTITLDAGGGVVDVTTLNVSYDESYKLPIPTKEYYEFVGWSDGSKIIKNGVWRGLESITLTALWKLVEYEITYDLDGGSVVSPNPTTYNASNVFSLIAPTKVGYTFIGWTGTGLTEITTKVVVVYEGGNRSYKANYEKNTYTVALDTNGGIINTANSFEIQFEDDIILPSPKKAGYRFDGWYFDDAVFMFTKWNIDRNVTLQARYSLIHYNIQYELNSGVLDETVPSTYTYLDNITLPLAFKTGYEFVGWKDLDTEIVSKTVTLKQSIGNKKYEAIFTPLLFTITLDTGGQVTLKNHTIEVHYDEEYILPNLSTFEGIKSFIGWYYQGEKVESGVYKTLHNITLTARWTDYGVLVHENGNTYVKYGYYPTTHVKDTKLINKLNQTTQKNELGYTVYEDNLYAAYTVTNANTSNKYSTGSFMQNKKEWFKVEAIKWIVLENDGKTVTLLSESLIDARAFDTNGKTYDSSDIRNYLLNTFMNSVFTKADQKALVKNEDCNNDIIWFLSTDEVTRYGTSGTLPQKLLCASPTDYALARGCYRYLTTLTGLWWLRTHAYANPYSVGNTGNIYSSNAATSQIIGVRPVIRLQLI